MKTLNAYKFTFLGIITVLIAVIFTSCDNSPSRVKIASGPPQIDRVSLIKKDSTTHEAGWGQGLLIIGNNLAATRSITFNGAEAYVNLAMATDHNIFVRVPQDAPVVDASDSLIVTNSAGSDGIQFFIVPPPPVIYNFTPSAGPAGQVITINGISLATVSTVKIGTKTATIVSAKKEQLKFKVPSGVSFGKIYIANPAGDTMSVHPFGFKAKIYSDAFNTKAYNPYWSWSVTQTNKSTGHVAAGIHAVKVHYDGAWGALSLHPKGPIDITKYDMMKISIYAGSDLANKVNIYINGSKGVTYDLATKEYKTFYIPVDSLLYGGGIPTAQLNIKNQGNAGAVIYVDNWGLY